jgi:8-oxo-dGTP pyrophosphatase MutT (NUDIX family)
MTGIAVRDAGGLVGRHAASGFEVLLVHRPLYDDWSCPKGKVKTGEPEEDAALREVDEETGLRGRLGPENGANRHAWGPAP